MMHGNMNVKKSDSFVHYTTIDSPVITLCTAMFIIKIFYVL